MVDVYDISNVLGLIKMYGIEIGDISEEYISSFDFGDLFRKYEMCCRFYFNDIFL